MLYWKRNKEQSYGKSESTNHKSNRTASAAGIFSNIANKFECRITFEYENSIANAKSVLSILGAGIKSGDEILLICEGEEEEKALKAMIEAVESGLGE